ncbi:MAG: hypothetical protein H0W75_10735, partial [Chitinophagaceae bacterium]|nr:hypothetical protein [Chitinophagaceae bacterium]
MYYELELGGKKRGLKFNQISLEVFTKNINAEALESSAVYATFFAGLIGNCVAKREDQDFSYADVMEWVDKLYEEGKTDEIKKVCDLWAETHTWKDWLTQFQDKLRTIINPENKTDIKKKKPIMSG